jgi:tetratricopeptide (TPR) repeat protein
MLRIALALIFAFAISLPALSQDLTEQERQCNVEFGKATEEKIRACTALIDSGRYKGHQLAAFFKLRGDGYYAKRDFKAAMQDFNGALRLRPDFADAYFMRGNTYVVTGNTKSALEDFVLASKHAGNDANRLNTTCYQRAPFGDLNGALADCNRSLSLRPNDRHTLDSRAFTYLKLNRVDEAIADYDHVLYRLARLHPRAGVSGKCCLRTVRGGGHRRRRPQDCQADRSNLRGMRVDFPKSRDVPCRQRRHDTSHCKLYASRNADQLHTTRKSLAET